MAKTLVIRVRKFTTNKLLERKQFILDVFSAEHENSSRKDISEAVAKKFKVQADTVVVHGLQSKFGGGRISGFGFIYNNLDALKKYETKMRQLRLGLIPKKTIITSRRLKKENKNKTKNLRGKAKMAILKGDKKKK